MKRVISAVVAIILVFQAVSFSTFAVPADDGKFKPAIDMKEQIDSEEMSEEELQKIYAEFMQKVESDVKAQKELVYKNREEEEQLKEKVKKDYVKELAEISALSMEEDISENMVMQSSELINAPYDLDAEVINASVNGKDVILTWMPSEGADGYNIYQQGTTDPVGTCTTERFEFNVLDNDFNPDADLDEDDEIIEHNYTVKAYKGTVESASSEPLTVVCGNAKIYDDKTLQNNCVYGDDFTILGGTLNLNGKMLKVYSALSQTDSQIDINDGKLIVMTNYTVGENSILKMDNPDDYVYVNGQFFFKTTIQHDASLMNNGLIQVVGEDFHVEQTGKFLPGGHHKVYLNGIDIDGQTTITFLGGDDTSKFNILGINKPLSKYNFNPAERQISSFYNQLIFLESDERYFGADGVHTPTGNFSRSYTDMTLSAPGLSIAIGRVYNSKSKEAGMLGQGWTFSYEGSVNVLAASGEFVGVYMPDGQLLNFEQISSDQTTKVYKGTDSRAELIYFVGSDSYELTFKDKTKYGFSKINNTYLLSYIEDCYGNRITITHLSDGKIDIIKDKNNRTIQVSYPNLATINVTDSESSRTISYSLNNGKLDTVTDANGTESYKYSYDPANGKLDNVKATVGIENGSPDRKDIDTIEYNNEGRIEKHTDMYGKMSEFKYGPGKTTTVSTINGESRKTVDMFDQSYAINEVIGHDGKSTVVEYFTEQEGAMEVNKYNEIESVRDIYGNKTIYGRDDNGNTTKVINPDGSQKEYGYYTDEARENLLKWEKDEENNYTYYDYNASRLLQAKYIYRTKVTAEPYPEIDSLNSANSIITTYNYRTDGQIEYIIEPEYYNTDIKTIYAYYPDGMLQSITDPEGKSVEYTYNSSRLMESEKIQLNSASTYMSTWYEYDKNGNLERRTLCNSDALSTASTKSIERYVYDAAGRLIQKISPNLYDSSHDNIEGHTYSNTGVGYRYEYKDGSDLIEKETDPEENVIEYTYDENGNVLTKKEPDLNVIGGENRTTYRYEYDSRDRLKEVYITPHGESEIPLDSYDYLSREYISETNSYYSVEHKRLLNNMEVSNETNKYDYAGRLVESVKGGGSSTIITTTQYNYDGTVKSTTDGEGYTTYYFYDTQKRPVHIWTPCEGTDGVTEFYTYNRKVYDDSGNLVNEAIRIDKVSVTDFENNRETIHNSSIDTGFDKSTNEYYFNNRLKISIGVNGEKKKYYYDGANNVNRIEEYKDESDANVIIRTSTNNYHGEPVYEYIYVRKGDIYGYDYSATGVHIVKRLNTYDKNGNKITSFEPANDRIETYGYDNLDRLTAKSQIGEDVDGEECTELTSWTLNWQGNMLSKIDARENSKEEGQEKRATLYTYDWRGLNKKIIDTVEVYDEASNTRVLKESISLNWYDYAGRKIADVSPNNYTEIMETIEDPYRIPSNRCKNYNHYWYDTLGRITKSEFVGEEYSFNSTDSTWSTSNVSPYK